MGEPWIQNSDFEFDSRPSLGGWTLGGPGLGRLVRQAPPGGGKWSLELWSNPKAGTGYAFAPVLGCRTGDVLSLFAYVKAVGPGGGGDISIHVGPRRPAGIDTFAIRASSRNQSWTRVSVQDTLSLAPGDSVWAVVSAPPPGRSARKGLFDLVLVEFTRQYISPLETPDTTNPYPFPNTPANPNLPAPDPAPRHESPAAGFRRR
jgi:hypothetical protein